MRRLTGLWTISAVTAAVGAPASCTPGGDADPAATTTMGPASTPVVEDHDLSALPSSSLGPLQPDVPAPAVAAATVAPNTIVMAVPPLPADLSPTRPTGPVAGAGDGHDHDSEAAATSSDVAVAWIVALYTARFDDPVGLVADELAALAATADVATSAGAAIEPVDVERSEARWPIVSTVSDVGADTWRIEFVVKRTLIGQVGPSTSSPLLVDVTVLDGHVTAWAAVEGP